MSGISAVEPIGASRRRSALTRAGVRSALGDLTRSDPERRQQLRQAWTWRVATVDLALALLLDVLTVGAVVHQHQGSVGVWLLDQALILPLALRRRHPMGIFTLLAALACVQWANGLALPADAALLVALYTVAEYEVRVRAAAAAVLLEMGVIWASLQFAPTGDGIVGSLVFLSGLIVAAYLLGTSLQTRRAYLASVEDRAHRLEIERDQQARIIQIEERTRIAREMHDIIAHNLSVMITLAAGAAATTPTDPQQAAEAMQQVASTGRGALEEMRQLLGFLREDGQPTGSAPQPGLEDLSELLEQVRSAGLPVRFSVQGPRQPLPLTTQLTVYRAVQEALTNIRKHGRQVSGATVALIWTPTALELAISDDGIRPATNLGQLAATSMSPGMGLAGMRERVAAAGGTMTSAPGLAGGWRVQIILPLRTGEPA